MINKFSLKIFNEIYWLRHPEVNVNYSANYDSFFYPLDSILEWNKIYGPKGFQQYQCLIPENNAKKGVHSIIEFINKVPFKLKIKWKSSFHKIISLFSNSSTFSGRESTMERDNLAGFSNMPPFVYIDIL